MATHLDLEEQEQLDQLKVFWSRYGNLISWVLIIALAAYAGWNVWNWYQRDQSVKAGAMYDALDEAAQAGDAERAGRVFDDMKARFPRTAFTQQGGLLAAKIEFEKGKLDAAKSTLEWVSAHAAEDEYRTVARLRLAGILLDAKQYDQALKQLDGADAKTFAALVDDRRGDIFLAEGKKDEARAAYLRAWHAMDPSVDYRHLIEAKLNTLGTDPAEAHPIAGVKP